MQPSEVCRICGGIGLFLQILDSNTNYSEDIEICLSLKVNADDGHSQVICHKCVGTLSWCKAYVSKINKIKKSSSPPSSKLCYSCRSDGGHLFTLPVKSAENLQEIFGLKILKPKNCKICHECQFSLDCVIELREKTKKAQSLSHEGQLLQPEVLQKNETEEDLVSNLKNRGLEVDDGSPLSRKSSRTPKPSKQLNGSAFIKLEEEKSVRKKAKKSKDTADDEFVRQKASGKKKSSCDKVKDHSSRENASESKLKRKRLGNKFNESGLDSSPESPSDSSRKTKSLKVDKQKEILEQIGWSDSDSSSICLASLSVCPVSDSKPKDETLKQKSKNILCSDDSDDETPLMNISDKISEETQRNAKSSVEDQSKKLSSQSAKKRLSEVPKTSDVDLLKLNKIPESGKDGKKRKLTDSSSKRELKSKQKRTTVTSTDEEVHFIKDSKRKNPVLQAYSCTVCNKNFNSTVIGKKHELEHDDRFNKFEIKLERMERSDIESVKGKLASKMEEDDDDDLWSTPCKEENKPANALNVDAFDALFDTKIENDTHVPSSILGSDSKSVGDKTDVPSKNSSDSEMDNSVQADCADVKESIQDENTSESTTLNLKLSESENSDSQLPGERISDTPDLKSGPEETENEQFKSNKDNPEAVDPTEICDLDGKEDTIEAAPEETVNKPSSEEEKNTTLADEVSTNEEVSTTEEEKPTEQEPLGSSDSPVENDSGKATELPKEILSKSDGMEPDETVTDNKKDVSNKVDDECVKEDVIEKPED